MNRDCPSRDVEEAVLGGLCMELQSHMSVGAASAGDMEKRVPVWRNKGMSTKLTYYVNQASFDIIHHLRPWQPTPLPTVAH